MTPVIEGLKPVDQQLEMREAAGIAIKQYVAGEAPMSPWLSNTRKQSSCFIARRSRVVVSARRDGRTLNRHMYLRH